VSEDIRIFLEDFDNYLEGQDALNVKLRKQIEKLLGPKPSVSEATFNLLKYQDEKGAKLNDYQVAYKSQNLADEWQHAFNILKQAKAVIASPFKPQGYLHRYWIYEKYPDRIFRKKLEAKG
jgi:hypothetical protein